MVYRVVSKKETMLALMFNLIKECNRDIKNATKQKRVRKEMDQKR